MNEELLHRALRESHFLQGVAHEHLDEIAGISAIRDLTPHEIVFREGEAAAHAYLVADGNVSLDICAAGAGCKRIMTVGPGELLGWSALVGQTRYVATARALESTRLVQIHAAQLLTLCHRNLELGFELMRRTGLALAKRLSGTRMQLMDVYGPQLPHVPEEVEASDVANTAG